MPHLSHSLNQSDGTFLDDNVDYKNGMSSRIAGLWAVGFLCTCAKNPDRCRFSQSSLEQVQPNNESSSNYPHRQNQKWPSEVAGPVTVMWNRLWNVWTWKMIRTPLALGERDRGHIPHQGFPVLWRETSQVWHETTGVFLLASQKRWFQMWI